MHRQQLRSLLDAQATRFMEEAASASRARAFVMTHEYVNNNRSTYRIVEKTRRRRH
jgi:hypothetical protein